MFSILIIISIAILYISICSDFFQSEHMDKIIGFHFKKLLFQRLIYLKSLLPLDTDALIPAGLQEYIIPLPLCQELPAERLPLSGTGFYLSLISGKTKRGGGLVSAL